MAKRKTSGTNTEGKPQAAQAPPAAGDVDARIVAFAEQLGHTIGSLKAKADGLIDREAVARQVADVRDRATHLLEQIGDALGVTTPAAARPAASTGTRPAARARGRGGGVVDAPGKKHRGPMPSVPRAKANPGRVAKMKAVNAARRRG